LAAYSAESEAVFTGAAVGAVGAAAWMLGAGAGDPASGYAAMGESAGGAPIEVVACGRGQCSQV